jgi:hypothetical protein
VPTNAKNELTEACVAFAAKDLRSFNSVTGEGFAAVVSAVVSIGRRFTDFSLEFSSDLIPNPTTISRRIERKADQVRDLIRPEIQQGNNQLIS